MDELEERRIVESHFDGAVVLETRYARQASTETKLPRTQPSRANRTVSSVTRPELSPILLEVPAATRMTGAGSRNCSVPQGSPHLQTDASRFPFASRGWLWVQQEVLRASRPILRG